MSKDRNQPIINRAKESIPYKYGKRAYENIEPRDSNPHTPRSFKYAEWDRGWFNQWNKSFKKIGASK